MFIQLTLDIYFWDATIASETEIASTGYVIAVMLAN